MSTQEIDTTLKPEDMDPEVRHVYNKILPVYNRCGHETQYIILWLFSTWQIERNVSHEMSAQLSKFQLFETALKEEIAAEELQQDKDRLNAELTDARQPTAN